MITEDAANIFATNMPHAQKAQFRKHRVSAAYSELVICGNFRDLLKVMKTKRL
jgi:hypothetical protein